MSSSSCETVNETHETKNHETSFMCETILKKNIFMEGKEEE
jgi:hypothetical protein